MSVYDAIESMSFRITIGEPHKISKNIILYSAGLSTKLRNSEFALKHLRELSLQSDLLSTSDNNEFKISEQIHFFVDAFFAFLYSSLDVIAQVLNQKLHLEIDEKNVSFKKIRKTIDNQQQPNTPLKSVLDTISRSTYFKNLDKYRNCSTHRRQIYIKTTTESISETRGYSSTSKNITTVKRYICDNPLTLNPSINQKRELIPYCEKILKKIKKSISQISENI